MERTSRQSWCKATTGDPRGTMRMPVALKQTPKWEQQSRKQQGWESEELDQWTVIRLCLPNDGQNISVSDRVQCPSKRHTSYSRCVQCYNTTGTKHNCSVFSQSRGAGLTKNDKIGDCIDVFIANMSHTVSPWYRRTLKHIAPGWMENERICKQ